MRGREREREEICRGSGEGGEKEKGGEKQKKENKGRTRKDRRREVS